MATTVLLAAALLTGLAACSQVTSADRGDPLEVAEAYAVADHELDHGTVYDLLGPEALEGADRNSWIDEQEPTEGHTGYLSRRYTADRCDARQQSPREVERVEPRDEGDSDGWRLDPGLRVVRVVVEFADGDTLQCLYGLRETPQSHFEIVATEKP